MKKDLNWYLNHYDGAMRCDYCGKFMSAKTMAYRNMVTPDSDYSSETYESACKKCVKKGRDK